MKINKWFVHFGVPGYYEGVRFPLVDHNAYQAMMEAFKLGQYADGERTRNG